MFPIPTVKYNLVLTEEDRIAKRIENRFIKNNNGVLALKVRDKNNKLVMKLEVEYMYGGRYCLTRITNRGKTRITLRLLGNSKKIAELIVKEREAFESPKLSSIKNKINSLKKR